MATDPLNDVGRQELQRHSSDVVRRPARPEKKIVSAHDWPRWYWRKCCCQAGEAGAIPRECGCQADEAGANAAAKLVNLARTFGT